jgi:hypothetical protein
VSHGVRREVLAELGADNTGGTVSTLDLTPDDAELLTLDVSSSTVDVAHALSKVELSVILATHTIELKEGVVWVLSAQTALETEELSLGVQANEETSKQERKRGGGNREREREGGRGGE